MLSLVKLCITAQLCSIIMPEWIFKQQVFGGAYIIIPFLMLTFLILAASNRSTTTFRRHETDKRRAYEEHISEVEHGSFTPLVFSFSGRMGKAATTTYEHLAHLLSEKWSSPYSVVMGWL